MSPIPIPTRRQALEQARRSPGFPGICAQCGCTENNACTDQGAFGHETCGWANKARTLCTNPVCLLMSARPQTEAKIDDLRKRVKKLEVPAKGTLIVALTLDGEVVINHPDLNPDKNGVGHIVFSPEQAEHLARLLLKKANEARELVKP